MGNTLGLSNSNENAPPCGPFGTYYAPFGWIPQAAPAATAAAAVVPPNVAPYLVPFPTWQQQPQPQTQQFQPQPPHGAPTKVPMLASILESYTFFSFVVTVLILFILWKKNPIFIQKEGTDSMIQERPSFAKLTILGIILFLGMVFGPKILNMKL